MPGQSPDKVRSGDPISFSAQWKNDVTDAKDDYVQRRTISVPKEVRHFPISTDKIKVQNDSGGDRRLGEVLSVDNVILIDIVDPEHLWQSGIKTDPALPFGILRKHVLSSGTPPPIEELQVSGVCKALVNIVDLEHKYAKVVCGAYVLESSEIGSVQILYHPDETGERECIVLLSGNEPAMFAEAFLDEDICGDEETVQVRDATTYPYCDPFIPPRVTNPRRHAGKRGLNVMLIRKQCRSIGESCEGGSEEEWQIVDMEQREYCPIIGMEDRPSCLVGAGLTVRGEWCPTSEPIAACPIVGYVDCEEELPACDTTWVFTPLFACCGQGSSESSSSGEGEGDEQQFSGSPSSIGDAPGPVPGFFVTDD